MGNFIIEKFYLFFQGVLIFQAFFLGILFIITRRKDILFYSIFLLLSAAYFFLNAPNSFFGLNDDVVFNSSLYLLGNIPLIVIANLFYILFLRAFFSGSFRSKSLDKIFYFIFLLTPVLIVAFFLCRYFKVDTQAIFYIVNLLATVVSIFIIHLVLKYRLPNTGWVAWGMLFNILGTALTILMIVLERYGVRNLLTYEYPLIFMRIGILADMFFYQVALLKKWHYQEKQLAIEKLQSELEVEKLRNKISGELHDDIGSTLSGIAMYSHMTDGLLQNGSYEKARNSVQVIQKSADEIVHKLGDMVWAINPDRDSYTGMLERIEQYGNEMCPAKNIAFNFSSDIGDIIKDMGMDVRQHLFLISKEAINNAVKYSGASNLFISAATVNNVLCLTIRDDGGGFDSSKTSYGNGLENIRRRAHELGGELILSSSPANGTVVEVKVKITP